MTKELLEWHATGPGRAPRRAERRRRARSARRRWCARSTSSPDAQVRARHAAWSSRSPTTCPSPASARSRRCGTPTARLLAKVTRSRHQPWRAGRFASRRIPGAGGRRRPRRPAAGQARDSRGAPTARVSPTSSRSPLRQASAAGAARGARARPATDDQEPPARAAVAAQQPQRKDRVYQWTAPFDEASRKIDLRERHPHHRASLLAGHAGALLLRARRPERRSRPRSISNDTGEEIHARALSCR